MNLDNRNPNAYFFFFPDNSFYALLGCFGAGFTLTVIIILSLWLAYNRTKNKSNSKDLKPTTPTQGSIQVPTTSLCKDMLHFSYTGYFDT